MTRYFRLLPFLFLASLLATSTLATAQTPEPCRSTHDARQAFGRCADDSFDFYAFGPYRDGVPRPVDVLGYPIGTWHTTYAGQAYATVDPSGDGLVVRLAEDPVFRAFADGPSHLLTNAIYLLGARGDRTASGY